MTTTLAPSSAPVSRRRRLATPLVLAGLTIGGLALLQVVSPFEGGHYPPCPFHALTGLYCPGCGMTRALADLGHGDVWGALHQNIVFTALVPVLLFLWGRSLYAAWTGRPVRRLTKQPGRWAIGLAAVIVVFGILRNIPMFAPFLAPNATW